MTNFTLHSYLPIIFLLITSCEELLLKLKVSFIMVISMYKLVLCISTISVENVLIIAIVTLNLAYTICAPSSVHTFYFLDKFPNSILSIYCKISYTETLLLLS